MKTASYAFSKIILFVSPTWSPVIMARNSLTGETNAALRAKQPYRRFETRVEFAVQRNGIKTLTTNPPHKLTNGRRHWPEQISRDTRVTQNKRQEVMNL